MLRTVLMLLACSLLSGCYYMQAAAGQWEVSRKAEALDAVIADPATDPAVAERLRLLAAARDFAVAELALPDNDSYRRYSDLERDYVVWNVFATPEFSLAPREWCFPVVGCVSYRGYFSRERAERQAARLQEQGFDVAVGGVAAYSTLGRFADPILNTMLRSDDLALVGLLFHELAHQVVYKKGDTAFNESFATAVEEFGVMRWLTSQDRAEDFARYKARREFRRRLNELVRIAREDLAGIYAAEQSDAQKRQAKTRRLQTLVDTAAALAAADGGQASGWLQGELNNAHLVPMDLYEGRLHEFRALLADCDEQPSCFYAAAKRLANVRHQAGPTGPN